MSPGKNGMLSAPNLPSMTKKQRVVTPREETKGLRLDNVRLRTCCGKTKTTKKK